MSPEFAPLKAFFSSIHVHFSPEWLESCINWCKSETLGPNHTPQDLQTKVYEQWLLLDLRDLEVPVLPPDLSTQQHFTLRGNFCLQMLQIVDISKPKLWQLQKIRNSHALTKGTQQDADVVGTGKRLLQTTLTDGVQEVEGMEYKPVPSLSLNLPPGTKIRVIGPVVVRRGRLMLEPQNVKVLGGEVEELLVSHAAENVLARALKMKENPNPGAIEEKMLAVEREEHNEGYVSTLPVPRVQKPPDQIIMTKEEEELMNQEFETLMEVESDLQRYDNILEEEFDNIQDPKASTSVQKESVTLASLDDGDDDIFKDIEIEPNPEPSVITIAKLIQNQSKISKGVFRIRAKFKGIEEKLTMTDDEYRLTIKVEDSTGELIVGVHSDVITKFAECSASEIISLKSSVSENDKEAKNKIVKAITKVKEKLEVLDSIIVVQIEKDKRPVITKVL